MFTYTAFVTSLVFASILLGACSVMAVSDSCNISKNSNYISAARSLMAGMDQTLFSKDGKFSKDGYIYLTREELAWGGGIGPSLCYAGIMGKYANDPNRCPTYSAPEVPGSWAFCSYKNMVVKARFRPTLLDLKSCPSASATNCNYEKTELKTKTAHVNGNLQIAGTIAKKVNAEGSLDAGLTNEVKLETKEGYSLKPNSTASLFGVSIIIETIVEEISVASVVDLTTRVCKPGAFTNYNITNNYFLSGKNTAVWASLVCGADDAVLEKRQEPAPPATTTPSDDWCFYYDVQSDSFLPEPCPSGVTEA